MWSEQGEVSTNWSKIPGVPSDYEGNLIINLGAKMDDSNFLMDDPNLTMSDLKSNIGAPAPTNWTK